MNHYTAQALFLHLIFMGCNKTDQIALFSKFNLVVMFLSRKGLWACSGASLNDRVPKELWTIVLSFKKYWPVGLCFRHHAYIRGI